MVKLIVVRHAKTAWNIGRRIQGRSDIPLSPEGALAAAEAAGAFKDIKIDKAYCSPLSRAFRTAEIMLGEPATADARLMERDFGRYDGVIYTDLSQEEHDNLFGVMDSVTGAESAEDVFLRTRSFILDMKTRHDGETVAVFSHGVCISFLMYAAKHDKWNAADYEMTYIKNCCLTEVVI